MIASSKKIQYFIHIGPYKTGSTSFQVFCDENRNALIERGIYYPPVGILNGQHFEIFKENGSHLLFDFSLIPESCDKVLFSSEIISSYDLEGYRKIIELFGDVTFLAVDRVIKDVALSQMRNWDRDGIGYSKIQQFINMDESPTHNIEILALNIRQLRMPFKILKYSKNVNAELLSLLGIYTCDEIHELIPNLNASNTSDSVFSLINYYLFKVKKFITHRKSILK